MQLSLKIKRLRELRNYSQDYLAACLKVSQQTYSRLERNSHKLSLERLQMIVDVLEFDLAHLISLPLHAFDNGIPQISSRKMSKTLSMNTRDRMKVRLDFIEEELQHLKHHFTRPASVSSGDESRASIEGPGE